MTKIISLGAKLAEKDFQVDRTGWTKQDYLNELQEFDFAGIYERSIGNPTWKEVIAIQRVNAYSLSIGILIARIYKNDEESAAALLKAFQNCYEKKHYSCYLRDLPPRAVGYVRVPPGTPVMTTCELFVSGRMQPDKKET